MNRHHLIWFIVVLYACSGPQRSKTTTDESSKKDSTQISQNQQPYLNPCPDFDSAVYHMNWVKLSTDCYIGNKPIDSIFVINQSQIDFKKFIQLTRINKIKSLLNIEDELYSEKYPSIYISKNIVAENETDDCYFEENNEIFGYLMIGNMNYVVIRGYGACLGHCTRLISINQTNQLVDQIVLTDDHSGKYGDGPRNSIKKSNDTTYYQSLEITGCRGWDDKIKGDSLFRLYYQKSKLTFCSSGNFKKEIIETDSLPRFLKMVDICGPE